MAKSKNESINISIFTALKVCEKAKNVPVLLMSNPGMGKTTSVEMFAEVRGYHLEVLRGNSTSPEEVLGYDTVPPTLNGDLTVCRTTIHLRPSWFNRIMEIKEKEGKNTLLFLDEITTAPEHVQSALLQLIFDKTVGPEKLPKDTLIVAAGNYVQNLSNQMSLLPPLMNRFMIYNIVPDVSDLDIFLNKYEGAIASTSGEITNKREAIKATMVELDNMEIKVSDKAINQIGEYIERQIRETTRAMMVSGERVVDMRVTDLQSIYSDAVDDIKLYGFTTMRTLGYFRDIAIASYICFGKPGLQSENFENMIDGLVGYGIHRDKNRQVVKTHLTKEFMTSMKAVINDIDKMQNTTIPKYETFLKDVLGRRVESGKNKGLDTPEIVSIREKIKEILADESIKDMERPLDPSIVASTISVLSDTASRLSNIKLEVGKDGAVASKISPEFISTAVVNFNGVLSTFEQITKFLKRDGINYDTSILNQYTDLSSEVRMLKFKINGIVKVISKDKAIAGLIPDIYKYDIK